MLALALILPLWLTMSCGPDTESKAKKSRQEDQGSTPALGQTVEDIKRAGATDQEKDADPVVDMQDMVSSDPDATDTSRDMGMMFEDEDMLTYPKDLVDYMCTFPSNDPACLFGDFGPGAYITEFVVEQNAQQPCCHDFNGDGTPDNLVGNTIISLAELASQGQLDVNTNIADAIALGQIVYLFEFQEFGNEQYDKALRTTILTGTDTDDDLTDNIKGTGSFYASPKSYDAQNLPLWGFAHSSVYNHHLVAHGGDLRIFFPGLLDDVDLWLTNVRVEADVYPGSDLGAHGHVELHNGKLSGALLRNRFLDSMNRVAKGCACLGVDILLFEEERNRYQCTLKASACANDPEEECRLIGSRQNCLSFALISSRADLDLDNDGKRDAYSFGATFKAMGTTLRSLP